MDLGREGFEESGNVSPAGLRSCDVAYLSVKLRISIGSSSNTSGVGCARLSCSSSSFLANTSPSTVSSSSGTTLVLRGSSMSVTCGPCSVLARLRDAFVLGAASSREKDRVVCKSLGRPDMMAIWGRRSGYNECRVPASDLRCY